MSIPAVIKIPSLETLKPIKASVLICTIRKEPRLKLTLECLKNQTHKNFDLIYVDALKDSRPKEFMELIKEYSNYYPIFHIKDKDREKLGTFPGICGARNTGLLYARGETIIMAGDHAYFQEFWIERHIIAYVNDCNSSSPLYIIEGKDLHEDLSQYKTGELVKHPEYPVRMYVKFGKIEYDVPSDIRIPGLPEEAIFGTNNWIMTSGGRMHAVSLQISLDRLLSINGFNEEYDKVGYGFEDCDMGMRMFFMGFPQSIDPKNWIVGINDKLNEPLSETMGAEGKPNKNIYDEFVKMRFPIWSNPHFNLRKSRFSIWQKSSQS